MFTKKLTEVVEDATRIARERFNSVLSPEHFLLAILNENDCVASRFLKQNTNLISRAAIEDKLEDAGLANRDEWNPAFPLTSFACLDILDKLQNPMPYFGTCAYEGTELLLYLLMERYPLLFRESSEKIMHESMQQLTEFFKKERERGMREFMESIVEPLRNN